MKEIDKIIKSTTPPKSKDVLWDNGKELLINRNGKWEPTSASKVNTVTQDWNAQEGEAGYIENKPFERKNIEPFISNNEVVYNTPDMMDVYIQCYDSIYSFPFGYNDDGFFIETEKEIYIPEESVSIKVRRYEYKMRVQSLNSELDVNDIPKCITVFYVDRKLNQSDIDNTVIKTTPQTLSNADKNQALANLGIDPVVWKYLCTPCIIKYGEKVPEELIGEFNEDVGESGGYELKYPYSGMYRIGIKEYSTEDDIDYNIIINPGTVNKYCLIMDYIWTPKNIAAGSIWINSDKKWDNDAF